MGLATMISFSITVRPDVMKRLDDLTAKHKAARSRLVKAMITVVLQDRALLQRVVDIL